MDCEPSGRSSLPAKGVPHGQGPHLSQEIRSLPLPAALAALHYVVFKLQSSVRAGQSLASIRVSVPGADTPRSRSRLTRSLCSVVILTLADGSVGVKSRPFWYLRDALVSAAGVRRYLVIPDPLCRCGSHRTESIGGCQPLRIWPRPLRAVPPDLPRYRRLCASNDSQNRPTAGGCQVPAIAAGQPADPGRAYGRGRAGRALHCRAGPVVGVAWQG